MINKNIKTNKGFIPSPNFLKEKGNLVRGFTLVETMFAVIILTVSIMAMMTVVANSIFAARYARNEITTNYLIQEVIDYIRNDRDASVFLQSGSDTATAWNNFIAKYNTCTDPKGCYFDVLSASFTPQTCSSDGCPELYYNPNATNTSFYTEDDNAGNTGKTPSGFTRKIYVVSDAEKMDVLVTVSWKNGALTKSRSLGTTLTRWQP